MNFASKIAIVGMACRFPGGSSTPAAYWQLLQRGVDATIEVPADRWSLDRFYDPDPETPGKAYVRRGGFLRERIDQFDGRFFGISPREATPLDPQQQMLLELTWEALEDAGIVPGQLRGSNTGVYIGGFMMDNQLHLLNVPNRETITTHTAISSTAVMLSNRLSYTFDFRGPSLTVDTACSSSLVALHLACRALLLDECDVAVSGGVNIMLRPEYTIAMCKGGFLAPDGRCKTFDARADGYARGEGGGVIILKRLQAALRDGDPIHAIIAGTGVNQDGRSDGITAPNAASQKALIRDVYARAGIPFEQIQYVEAHGTGTQAGDLAEATALGEALAMHRTTDAPLWIGSAKTNIGHLEAAAGVAGVIKAVLALKHKTIPPNLHFEQPRPDISFDRLQLRVPVQPEAWPPHAGPAGAAVNSFGYGGTNAHAILLEPPIQTPLPLPAKSRPVIIPITAAGKEALTARIRQLAHHFDDRQHLSMRDVGYTLARRRTHHTHRLAVVAASMPALRRQLHPFVQPDSAHPATPRAARTDARLAFVYTGMGSQSWGMGIDLLQQSDVARRVLAACDAIWRPLAGWSLEEKLFSQQSGRPMTAPAFAQPANFVLQLMLTEIARSYGIAPDGIAGHSVGEIAAAFAAGSLSLEDALHLTYHRSRLQQRVAGQGTMLAVALSAAEVAPYLAPFSNRVSVAAVNSPNSVTLAGDPEAIGAVAAALTTADHFNRILKVDVAYHSHQMDPLAAEFRDSLQTLTAQDPAVPLYTTVNGRQVVGSEQDCDYWWQNARQPVQLAAALTTMLADGYNVFVEIGPHPVLAAAIQDGLHLAGIEGERFAALQRAQPELETFLVTLANVYACGVHVAWEKPYPVGNLVSLPSYPWQRETMWHETEASQIDRLGAKGHPLLTLRPDEPQMVWQGEVAGHIQHYLPDHQIQEEAIFPAAGYVEMGLVAKRPQNESVVLEAVSFHQTLAIKETPNVRLCLDADGVGFAIYSRSHQTGSRWTKHANGRLLAVPAPAKVGPLNLDALLSRCQTAVDVPGFYQIFGNLGLAYGPAFQTLRQAHVGHDEIVARLQVSGDHAAEVADYYVHPTLLDGAFQALLALHVGAAQADKNIFIPVGIDQLRFHSKPMAAAWCHGVVTEKGDGQITGDLVICDDDGTVCVEIFGLHARAQRVHVPEQAAGQNLLYGFRWEAQTAVAPRPTRAERWLLFADAGGIGVRVADDAAAQRIECIIVRPGARFKKVSDTAYEVARESQQDMEQLFRAVGAEELDAVVYLWACDIPDAESTENGRIATGMVDVIDLTHIVQGLKHRSPQKALTVGLAMIRAQSVANAGQSYGPGPHAVIGFGRVLAVEYPDYRVKLIDLNSRQTLRAGADLLTELLSGSNEMEVAFRSGVRYVNRLIPWGKEQTESTTATPGMRYALDPISPERLEDLSFREIDRAAPGPDEVEVAVRTLALNADALVAQVASPGTNGQGSRAAWRFQCAGVVAAVGDHVTQFEVGQAVVVPTTQQPLQSCVTVPATHVLSQPAAFSFADAAVLPDWLTAYYALFYVAQLKAADSIRIHHGCNDVGLAAVFLARWCGATIYATAWSAEQRAFLHSLGVQHVTDSHTLGFVDDVQRWTGGRGVDVVMGAVSDDLLQKSVTLLADNGRFVHLGNDKPAARPGALPVTAFSRGRQFKVVDPDRMHAECATAVGDIWQKLQSLFATGAITPMPIQNYAATRLGYALRTLSDGEYSGKLVVDMHDQAVTIGQRLPASPIRPDAGYLIVGGFGGLGLKTVQWLAARGARHIAILSRSGPGPGAGQDAVQRLQSAGVHLLDLRLDVADRGRVAEAVQQMKGAFPPLRGVIYTAGVIDDAPIESLQAAQVARVMGAKALGAWHLHQELCAEELDFFVCYSSVTAMLGNLGQANYAAANAFLDGLVTYRRARGAAGLSLNWGSIGDVGMVARNQRLKAHLEKSGLLTISSAQALASLEEALSERWPQVGVFDMAWPQWGQQIAGSGQERLVHIVSSTGNDKDLFSEWRTKIALAPPHERFQHIFAEVVDIVSQVLRIHTSRIEPDARLIDLGIDSLMAVELASLILTRTGVRFRALFIARGPTIAEIAEDVLKEVNSGAETTLIAVR